MTKANTAPKNYLELDDASEGTQYGYRLTGSSSSTPAWNLSRDHVLGEYRFLTANSSTEGTPRFESPSARRRENNSSLDAVSMEEEEESKDWIAQVEPGVLITLISLPEGGNDLKRIRFSNEQEVTDYVASMIPLLAASSVMDGIQGALSGIARGRRQQKLGAYVNLGAYYMVGVPVAVLLAFVLHVGGRGLWLGIICGLSVQTILLILITSCTDWEQEVGGSNFCLFEIVELKKPAIIGSYENRRHELNPVFFKGMMVYRIEMARNARESIYICITKCYR